ncbi:hypothetical protein PCE38_004845 [Citrobacter freundii]|uniref:hypothetical protein n=1 Tax=Citrobacter freundii TaxID=546 RepID=UPI001FF5DD5F|nr:hypothetical protein [Citrobacter freundii]EKW9287093.1 hypothetical protein [Citrobacter freundii]MCJ8532051.1 hypothetical protein [Citrobacter freundii]
MGTLTIAAIALFIGIWHEINRFPATGKSILSLQQEVMELKDENENLRSEIDALKDELSDISNQIERIKDPEYYALLDAGDGDGLYALDKLRGNI